MKIELPVVGMLLPFLEALGMLDNVSRVANMSSARPAPCAKACAKVPCWRLKEPARYCGGCLGMEYACHRTPHNGMSESCNRRHDMTGVAAFPPSFLEKAQPSCAAGWRPNRSLTAQYCEHFTLEDGPHDVTQIERTGYRALVHTCVQPELLGVLIGPFRSSAGQFTSLNLPFDLVRPGSRIIAFTADAVDVSGTPVGYPPLHMHHVHLAKGEVGSDSYYNHWWEVHGDYGVGPYGHQPEQHLPEGYCDVDWGGISGLLDAQVTIHTCRE